MTDSGKWRVWVDFSDGSRLTVTPQSLKPREWALAAIGAAMFCGGAMLAVRWMWPK